MSEPWTSVGLTSSGNSEPTNKFLTGKALSGLLSDREALSFAYEILCDLKKRERYDKIGV
ncbi:7620_t:CDS:2 [Entrophospora sp. SA101]|nr:7620_t:CDS:2 [Entrophospora sp. SA101]